MIRLRTAARVMPAFWLGLPIAIFAAWYVTLIPPSDGYATDATTKASMTLAFVGSFCAGCAAWEGSRLRRAGWWGAPWVRSPTMMAIPLVGPVVVIGLFAVSTAVVVQLARSGAPFAPDGRVVAIAALDLTAIAIVGFAAGVRFPFAIAGPAAVVVPFVWLAFVPAIYPVWLRHVTGMFRDCCELAQQLSDRPLVASSVLNLGLIIGGGLVLGAGGRRIRKPATSAGLVVGAAVLVAISMVAGMPYAPVAARDPSTLICQAERGIILCTWPEHRAAAPQLGALVRRLHVGWLDAGIDAPDVFTEADLSVAPAGAAVFAMNSRVATPDDVIGALAEGALPVLPDCPGGATGMIAHEYLAAWYAKAGGMTDKGMQQRFGFDAAPYPQVLDVVTELMSARPDTRRDWVARAEQVTQACDDWSPTLLAVNR